MKYCQPRDFPGGSNGKESAYSAGDLGSIPGLGRSPGEGKVNPLQYSCLEMSMDRGAWQAAVHWVARVGHDLRNLYAGQEATIRTGHGTTDWIQIGKGVRQGCILSPCLFTYMQSTS